MRLYWGKASLLSVLFLILFVFTAGPVAIAQTADTSQLQSLQDEQKELQQQLADIEKQIKQFEGELKTVTAQKKTLANKIKQLQAKQSELALKIKATNIKIASVQNDITFTQANIEQNEEQVGVIKQFLAQVVRQLAQLNNYSLLEIFFTSKNISDFYQRWHSFEVLHNQLAQLLTILEAKAQTLQDTKDQLKSQQEQQENLLNIISLQKTQLSQTIQDQNGLLSQTKGKEATYQETLKQTKQIAASIRSRIYDLLGVIEKINFGQAVQIAQWASNQTGVRPAFLLAILTQESNLGKNVGTCNRAGDPPTKSWRVVMKPERDHEPFLQITKELGKDPDTTPISCPMRDKSGKQIGWGGAMGPAQFIPSTWMGYKNKITAITGKTADPWDIRDAFLAASLKLKADGAGTQSGEWAAAMRYFSGSTNTAYRFYGDNVVTLAEQYQNDIDQLNK